MKNVTNTLRTMNKKVHEKMDTFWYTRIPRKVRNVLEWIPFAMFCVSVLAAVIARCPLLH